MKSKLKLIVVLNVLSLLCTSAQTTNPEITSDELKAHVKYLASDELEGRGSGTEGNRKAAEYIAKYFKQYGLKPAGDDGTYFQKFEFVSALKLGDGNALSFEGADTRKLKVDEDFRPLGFSMNTTVSAHLVFAGYGISAPEKNYDDFKDIDVSGKAVVVLRYGPDGNDPHSDFEKYTSLRNKARIARDKGAVALLIVIGPADGDDDLIKLSFDNAFANSGIAAISIKRSALNSVFKSAGRDLKDIQDSIKSSKTSMAFDIPGVSVQLKTDVVKIMGETSNILGLIEGNDPALASEVVVLGAHMDHLGYGGPGSGSLVPDSHEIHNGADDNASGTSALMELAEKFSSNRSHIKRSLLCVAFSGEELGTLGSAHYVNHPFISLQKTVAMFNFDMVGRLEKGTLTVYGTGTSREWPDLLGRFNRDSAFTLKQIADGFGPSDQTQFYAKDIPVLFFFTGTHSDYHKPSDDWDKLNYPGEETIARYAYNMIADVAQQAERPAFTRAATTAMGPRGDSRGFSVTLGVVPDYGESGEGMKIGGTRPNGPAEKAGLKSGDVIVKMAGKKILNIYDYMGVLGELKAGDEVEVEVIRDGTQMKFTATMTKRE